MFHIRSQVEATSFNYWLFSIDLILELPTSFVRSRSLVEGLPIGPAPGRKGAHELLASLAKQLVRRPSRRAKRELPLAHARMAKQRLAVDELLVVIMLGPQGRRLEVKD